MASEEPKYDLVLLGASGYTGKYCAEHIAAHCPTDLRWAVAGRSFAKLSAVVDEIQSLNPDRRQPGVEVVQLNKRDLDHLAKRTTVLISTVGPYHLYGTPVVEACVDNGTHYLDVTGESPWVLGLVEQYHNRAKATGAIVIPQMGIESAPADLITYTIVSNIRSAFSVGAREVVLSVHDISASASGGTIATALGIFDYYSLNQIKRSTQPYSMCPLPPPKATYSPSMFTKLLGVRTVRDLGTLTTSIQGGPDSTIVNRSWALLDGGRLYGQNFQFSPYMRARNAFTGIMLHLGLAVGLFLITIAPIRSLVKRFLTAPGEGPTKETASSEHVEYRAVGLADQPGSNPGRVTARLRCNGSMYLITGIFVVEAAMTLLKSDTEAKKLGGGVLTPATLGQPFITRLENAGLNIETKRLPD